jgi:hypothetical protein
MSTKLNDFFYRTDLNSNSLIYHFLPHRYVEQLFSGKLTLRATHCWPDPYENLISNSRCHISEDDGSIVELTFDKDRFPSFGQCWSTLRDSDALWRIYSRIPSDYVKDSCFFQEERVRIRTTAGKLVNSVAGGIGPKNTDKCFITSMEYLDLTQLTERIMEEISARHRLAFSGVQGHVDALRFKRDAFVHEHEVRLLYIDADREFENKQQIEIPIDVNSLIEEITLDPRVPVGEQEHLRKQWLQQKGFKNEINRSTLYQAVIFKGVSVKVPAGGVAAVHF